MEGERDGWMGRQTEGEGGKEGRQAGIRKKGGREPVSECEGKERKK